MNKEESELIAQFPRVAHRVKRKLVAGHSFARFGLELTQTQIQVLFITDDHHRLTMTALHELTGLEKGSLTTVIDQLIGKGMIERRRTEEDRRRVYVSLTGFGREKVALLREDVFDFIKERLEQLSAIERGRFYQAVKILSEISERL